MCPDYIMNFLHLLIVVDFKYIYSAHDF